MPWTINVKTKLGVSVSQIALLPYVYVGKVSQVVIVKKEVSHWSLILIAPLIEIGVVGLS